MYDELVKQLRDNAEFLVKASSGYLSNSFADTMNQAAKAIEDLSRKYIEERNAAVELTGELASKPRWVSVTERLPEQKTNQNTLDFEYVLCATTFGDVRPYKFGRKIGQGEPHFWNGAGYVDAYVTHWMPLPEPPKEET